jgi:hypothetical protein
LSPRHPTDPSCQPGQRVHGDQPRTKIDNNRSSYTGRGGLSGCVKRHSNAVGTWIGMAQWKELPIYAQFVKAVFSIMISSAVAEALFNKYSFTKNRFRSSMLDRTVASSVLSQEKVY